MKRLKALAIDDASDMLFLISTSLKNWGNCEVTTTEDWEEALEKAETEQPDVILSDLNLQDIDGYELCRRLKENPRTSGIPVIFLTALDTKKVREKIYEAGAAGIIEKPFEPFKLCDQIKNIISDKN